MSPLKATPEPSRSSYKASAAAIALAIAATAGLSALLHARVALDDEPTARAPLTVTHTPYRKQPTYQREVSYLGLIVAGRRANLGFEIAGQIDTLAIRQGSPVEAGELLATLDDATLQSRRGATAADLERARTELELARLKAKRQSDLRETGAVSREAFDETRLRARALEAQVEAVEAGLRSIDIELEKTRLLAPYSGIVADRYLNLGAVVSPGAPVVRLIETASQEAHIGVSASRVRELVPGSIYNLELRDHSFDATLLSVRPDVDPITRATTAVFAVPSQVRGLDGEPVTLRLQEAVSLEGGWLPIAALLEGRRGIWTVLRLEPDGNNYRTVREAVEVLDTRRDQVYVLGTLADGARVVAGGLHRITPGSLVQLKEAP